MTITADIAQIQPHIMAMLLGMPRLLMICYIAPFLGGNQLPGQVRLALAFAAYMILHPFIADGIPPLDLGTVHGMLLAGGMLAKEVFLGFLLAMLSGLMFWTFMCMGFFIDNQRGAGMAADTDPLSGEQTSPTGSFFFQSAVFVFFSSGAFLAFLSAVYASYEFWPPASLLPAEAFTSASLPLFFAEKVAKLALDMVLLAGPVVLACLFVDLGLGIVNRFASQLHVYVLAMPIKSGIASLLIIIYFGLLMKDSSGMFSPFDADLMWLRRFLP